MAGSSLTRSATLVLALLFVTDSQLATGASEDSHVETTDSSIVRTIVGGTAVLRCDLCSTGNYVHWARGQTNIKILSLYKHFGFTMELNRMEAVCLQDDEVCLLTIRNVQKDDSGLYYCREDGEPPIQRSIYLSVFDPGMTILGEPSRFHWQGSSINLTCEVQSRKEPEDTVLWMHNDMLIDPDQDSRLTITTETDTSTISYLMLKDAQPEDSGIYTCKHSDGRSDSFNVDVMEEPGTTILGEPFRVHWQGSSISLTCVVHPRREPEDTVLWMHNDLLIDPDHDSRLTITTEADTSTISHLMLKDAQPKDSGTYTCKAHDGSSDSVAVNVMQVVPDDFYPSMSGGQYPTMSAGQQRPLAAAPVAGLLALAAAFSSHCR